ncbi:hypothetical protein CDL15_Pgr011052 [Punica granatum]|uniref:Uncharacterized protein n=1 Tax=Punica granatum TaxID=22663 RepID=A0A218XN74_PUNGR|nr:hypothetical protein CDL15_Pgr011052 [Punica granatum]
MEIFEDSKRTKMSASRQYSSSSNCDETNFNLDVAQSLVCPQGSKAANMKLKGKSKAFGSGSQKDEKYNELKSQVARRLDLLDDLKKDK